MTTDTGPWIVRLGKVRGKGDYITQEAAVFLRWTHELHTSRAQRDARRFTTSALAEFYADAFKGRVVRLKERAVEEELTMAGMPPTWIVTAEDWRKMLVAHGWPKETKVRLENGRVMVTRHVKPHWIIQEPEK